jgi:ADP-ribosylglycohydrolase
MVAMTPERIAAAMHAFAAGDALGVPWEGRRPDEIDLAAITTFPPIREGWAPGETSDDTDQMLLVAELLVDTDGDPTAALFMERLAAAGDAIRGIGPSTRRALAHFRATGTLPPVGSGSEQRATNGAAMRMLPVGLMTPAADADRRRELTRTLSIATHQAPAAIGAACVFTAMASSALEGSSISDVLDVARAEADWVASEHAPLPEVVAALDGRWAPGSEGVHLDADQTMAAVVYVVSATDSTSAGGDLGSALVHAVTLGDDTDTVAALVGGILGARTPEQLDTLDWLDVVVYSPRPDLAAGLHDLHDLQVLRSQPRR